MGWRNIFPVVLLCQFLVLAGNRFRFYTLMYLEYNTVVVLCQFFWFQREIVFGVTYVFRVQYSCTVVSVFWLWREIVFKMRTRFYKKILLGYFFMIRQPMSVFIRPNTLLLCITQFCIFLLYRPDPQVEVQIRILLKNKYEIVYTGNPTLISQKMASQNIFLVKSELSITTYLFLVFY